MTEDEIIRYVRSLPGAVALTAGEETGAPEAAWGDSFFFHDPDGDTPQARRFPFATLVTHDYAGFDTASRLDRPGAFRLNIAVGRELFTELLGQGPEAAPATAPDYTAPDRLLPHPVYAAQGWIAVVNPAGSTAARVPGLLAAAHDRARARQA
ncbi:DUF6194 family protein [Streptomyces sp. NPDC047002]|uniref:DUF6194 family protein n=1 Tax=Streptomyces sp. NPDC047002 TaxID=3155475 RepID=UPI0034514426